MTTARLSHPGDLPGSYIYAVTGEAGAISYTHPGPGKPGSVGVHSATPTDTGERRSCDLLPGGECWAGSLPGFASRTGRALKIRGEDALYRELESTYRAVFPDTEEQR